MLKKFLTIVLPLALPFILYGIYLLVERSREDGPRWRRAPVLALTGVGVALMATVLIAVRFWDEEVATDNYHPPRFEDGRIVPSRIGDP